MASLHPFVGPVSHHQRAHPDSHAVGRLFHRTLSHVTPRRCYPPLNTDSSPRSDFQETLHEIENHQAKEHPIGDTRLIWPRWGQGPLVVVIPPHPTCFPTHNRLFRRALPRWTKHSEYSERNPYFFPAPSLTPVVHVDSHPIK